MAQFYQSSWLISNEHLHKYEYMSNLKEGESWLATSPDVALLKFLSSINHADLLGYIHLRFMQ